MTTRTLSLDAILVAEDRQRQHFPEQEQKELRDSIMGPSGLIYPLLVRPAEEEGKFLLVAGERRYRAISTITKPYEHGEQVVQPGHVPVIVRNFSQEIDAYEAELHENIYRVNLTWQEKAQAIARLHHYREEKRKLDGKSPQTPGMTALLVDGSPKSQETGHASGANYRLVNNALLLDKFQGDADIWKASSFKEATMLATRKIEEENIKKLRELQTQRAEAAKAVDHATSISNLAIGLMDDRNTGNPPIAPNMADFTSPLAALLSTPSTNHVLHKGSIVDYIDQIPDGCVNVVLTDPPYGMGVDKFAGFGLAALPHKYQEDNYEALHECLCVNLDRICATNAHVYIFCDIAYFPQLRQLVANAGFNPRRTPLIWDKQGTGALVDGANTGYTRNYEMILFAARGERKCSALSEDVITVGVERNKIHGAQKPTALYTKLLKMSSVPGHTVFDPFAGSGTIYRAANEAMCNAIGIEKNETSQYYCEQAMKGREIDTNFDENGEPRF